MNDLTNNIKRGDAIKIAEIANVSEPTAWKWLRDETYREEIGIVMSTNLTNAYAQIIKKNNEQRQKNLNKLNSINHE